MAGTYQFDAYGNTTSHTGADTPLQYAGQYLDAESGLYWMRARYYDPTSGQFVSRDPIAALTLTPYAYVGGDPTNAIDPDGMKACKTWDVACKAKNTYDDFMVGAAVVNQTVTGGDYGLKQLYPEQSQAAADFAGGVLDGLTLGHADLLLSADAEDNYSTESRAYLMGGVASLAAPLGGMATAAQLSVKCMRFANAGGGGIKVTSAGETLLRLEVHKVKIRQSFGSCRSAGVAPPSTCHISTSVSHEGAIGHFKQCEEHNSER